MEKDHAFVGIWHEKVNNDQSWVTYIIIGDKSIHDISDISFSNKITKTKKINQKSLKSLFENVKEKTDQNKNGNDTTRYEDLSYFK